MSRAGALLAATLVLWTGLARADESASGELASPPPGRLAELAPFFAGAALGFAAHESSHLVLDLAFGAHPDVHGVDFHGIPFFAIGHRSGLPHREEALISWAGFGSQHVLSEWLLSHGTPLRERHAPVAKGVLAFHVVCSAVYGVGAFPRTGPAERDTRGIASSASVDERLVGALVVGPAAVDAYRYFHPRARWAPWVSRAGKLGLLLLVLR
jgi:hypothetical protein